jgi:putative tricarboxylic transport membrane protein
VISGVPRYSFDIPELTDGIGFVAIAMGVFGFGEIIANLSRPAEHREVFTKDVKGLWPTSAGLQGRLPGRAARHRLGSILGVLPGGGALLSSFAAYTLEKKTRGRAGRGALRPGQHPRRGRARVGQQRRRADRSSRC